MKYVLLLLHAGPAKKEKFEKINILLFILMPLA
jgi:hypothetical protein